MSKDLRAQNVRTATPQKRGKLKALIILLGVVAPFSTDMCLPALPTIAADLAVSYTQVNAIIFLFFLFMALSMFFSGPLSDAFGRKPVLLTCLGIFTVANLMCALAPNIVVLSLFRALAACGAGGMISASTALIKDGFEEGEPRDRALAFVQSFHVIGPLLAPVLGALLLVAFSWHASFLVLAGIGALGVIFAVSEPVVADIPMKGKPSAVVRKAFSHVVPIVKNPALITMLGVAGLVQACFMAYLATSSYIYTVQFGMSETAYSIFFACSALLAMIGPRLFIVLGKTVPPRFIYGGCLVVIMIAGVAIATIGKAGPFAFFFTFVMVAIANSTARPLAMSVMLRQHEGDTGTLSSVINFGIYLVGLVGMGSGSLASGDFVLSLGIIVITLSAISFVCFVVLMKSSIYIRGMSAVRGKKRTEK